MSGGQNFLKPDFRLSFPELLCTVAFAFEMIIFVVVGCSLLAISSAVMYIDNVAFDSNPAVVNLSIKFTHNQDGDSVTNLTFQTFLTITKMLVYVKINIADDQNGAGYKRELLNTAIDVEKWFKNMQSNILMKGYIQSLKKGMDFDFKFPLLPVSARHLNKFFF